MMEEIERLALFLIAGGITAVALVMAIHKGNFRRK